jgi:hypothetical protein
MLFSLSFLSTSSSREKKAEEENEEEEVSFTSDLKGDKGLVLEFDHDFVPHPSLPPEASQWLRDASTDSIEEESKGGLGSEVYNEETDYSWDSRK